METRELERVYRADKKRVLFYILILLFTDQSIHPGAPHDWLLVIHLFYMCCIRTFNERDMNNPPRPFLYMLLPEDWID